MVFKCQEDSFLQEYESTVISCTKIESKEQIINGTKQIVSGYEIICENTILFPEGGGQPCDYGKLNNIVVNQVVRRGDQAVHYTSVPFNIGDCVVQQIDWNRRFDHMQQHSGQHLITAIFDREFKFNTSSWWLGTDESYIELDTDTINVDELNKVECICNELIRKHTPVTVSILNDDELTNKNDVRARGLPDDHKGDIRIITIAGVESNMCCGTHVTNLSQLQAIKLLRSEKGGKRKDKSLVYFLVGNRILTHLNQSVQREQQLTALLKSNPQQHAELVEKLQKNLKITTKHLQNVLKEIASHLVNNLKSMKPKPKFYCLHRKDAEPDFMNIIIKEYNGTDIFFFLSVGDDKSHGNILLYGDEIIIQTLGTRICELLNGKGVGKGNRYQAKVQNMNNRNKCIDLIEQYFKET